MGHVVAPDLAARVRQPRMQQQPGRLDRAGAQEHGGAALPAVLAPGAIDHRRDPPGAVPLEAVHAALRPDLRARGHGLRQVGHVHAGLGADAAALVAVAAVDAGMARPVAGLLEIPRHHRDRPVADAHAQRRAPGRHHLRRGVARHRGQGVTARRLPRVRLRPRHADERLHFLVIRPQFLVAERPVGADALFAAQPQVPRVRARRVGAPVQGGAADARAAVVGAERFRRAAGAQPLAEPVDVGRDLVGHEILRVPVPPGLQRHHPQPRPRQPRQQRGAARARADHHRVHYVVQAVARHPVQLHGIAPAGAGSQGSASPGPTCVKPGLGSPSPP